MTIESSSRSLLNMLNLGANSDNVATLADYIRNEVYRLQPGDHSEIRIVKPEIRMRGPGK